MHPRYAFLFYSFFGLAVSINGCYLTKNSELDNTSSENEVEIPSSFTSEIEIVYTRVKNAVFLPEMYSILIYILLNGFISPNFDSFKYYFFMDTIKISQMEYSKISTLG